jgi:UDP-glucuronate 4-epimerase
VSIKRNNVAKFIDNENFILIEDDIRNPQLLDKIDEFHLKIDKIVHLAALAGVRKSFERDIDYLDVNVSGTINMLRIADSLNISRFLNASSSSVYGDREGEMKESDELNPISPYAMSKLLAEKACEAINRKFDILSMRFFSVYGRGQRPDLLFSNIERSIKEDTELIIYGDGTKSRDWTPVEYIVSSIEKLLTCNLDTMCESINIGSGNPTSVNDAIESFAIKLGKYPKIEYRNNAIGDVTSTFANTDKLKKYINI